MPADGLDDLEDLPVSEMEVLDEDSRRFVSWGSVEVVDKEGDLIPMDELKRVMPDIMERGGVLMDSHSNRHVGEILNYNFTDKTVDGEEKAGLIILGRVYDHTSLDDKIWNGLKSGEKGGLSFGGRSESSELELVVGEAEQAEILQELEGYEWSIVDGPANQEANTVAVNPLAKEVGPAEVAKSDGMISEDVNTNVSPVNTLRKLVKESSDTAGITNAVFGEDATSQDVTNFLLGNLEEVGKDVFSDCVQEQVDRGKSRSEAFKICSSRESRNELKRSDLFESEEEARTRAEELGLNGVHSHEVEGETMFMPGQSHEEYEERMSDEKTVSHKRGEEDNSSMTNQEENNDDGSVSKDAVVEEAIESIIPAQKEMIDDRISELEESLKNEEDEKSEDDTKASDEDLAQLVSEEKGVSYDKAKQLIARMDGEEEEMPEEEEEEMPEEEEEEEMSYHGEEKDKIVEEAKEKALEDIEKQFNVQTASRGGTSDSTVEKSEEDGDEVEELVKGLATGETQMTREERKKIAEAQISTDGLTVE